MMNDRNDLPGNNKKRELPHQKKRKQPEDKPVIIQERSLFLKSKIWRIQKDYYESQGVDAWKGKVPFYVTSNPLIANKYADMIFSLISDGIKNRSFSLRKPIYILELGAGSGKFAYHLINELILALSKAGLGHVQFKYVLTDLSAKNIEFWSKHEQLRHFVRQGVLDFARYDVDERKYMRLINTNELLEEKTLSNPPIVLSNYFIDSISHDLFYFHSGRIERGYLSMETNTTNLAKGLIVDLNKLKLDFSYQPSAANCYDDKTLNDLLRFYGAKIADSKIYIPVTMIETLKHLRSFHKRKKLFFIASDKGYTHLHSLSALGDPHFAFHGSFSIMANFHALSFYCHNSDGDVLIPNDSDGLSTQVFSLGTKLDKFPSLKVSFERAVNGFSVQNFLTMKNFIVPKAGTMSVQELMSLLKMSNWDAKVLLDIANSLIRKFNEMPLRMKNELKLNLRHMERNHYFFPNNENPIFEMARINYCLGAYEESVRLYRISIKHYGESIETLFNIGLSYYYTKNLREALQSLEKLVSKDPSDSEAKEWIARIKSEMLN